MSELVTMLEYAEGHGSYAPSVASFSDGTVSVSLRMRGMTARQTLTREEAVAFAMAFAKVVGLRVVDAAQPQTEVVL